jgi:hypothetical protein
MKALRWLRYKLAGPFRHQTCEDCYRDGRESIWFHVPDDVWHALRGDRHVLCLTCFDRRAERECFDYRRGLDVQGRASWLTGLPEAAL